MFSREARNCDGGSTRPSGRRNPRPAAVRESQGQTVYSSAFESVALFGAAKPLSRPQNWQSMIVPAESRKAPGAPPSAPTENAFMSIEYTPEQSFGGALPPELSATPRRTGPLTQSSPPLNALADRPVLPYIKRPGLLLITLIACTVKPAPAVALDTPLDEIDGVQPSEFTFAMQYVAVGGHCTGPRSRTNASAAPFVSPGTRLVARLSNETQLPSAEIAGSLLVLFACTPAGPRFRRSVVPSWRLRRKMSVAPFVSPATRLLAKLANATNRPSTEITAS